MCKKCNWLMKLFGCECPESTKDSPVSATDKTMAGNGSQPLTNPVGNDDQPAAAQPADENKE